MVDSGEFGDREAECILRHSKQQQEYMYYTFLFYSTSRETYNALANWLTDARTLASPNIVIVLVGNKKDLESDREVTFMEASRFAQENGKLSCTHLLLWLLCVAALCRVVIS